nr:Chain C, Spike protein S2 [Severe acute respiratory syndrome coronavirus 2]7N1B_F Chain F, Spike protein S2 [Severe acute respiratory syndrome coronavirus 2]7N1E_C Chain C, Spike protein S2 [Severe acute respiratory syndrome coronavirus 2]8GOM_C Chain C, Spike protein S2 [Severe acute respiratory syndrome coronavirus 2]
RLQSLQTYV